jgi:hypothetical protein
MEPKPRYWFPAKTYGWGWGAPSTWEGWVVLVGFLILLLAGHVFFVFFGPLGILGYIANAILWSVVLLWISFKKGEPPRWRWGKDS